MKTTGHIAQLGPARAAWFPDPDGNTQACDRVSAARPLIVAVRRVAA